MRLENTKIALIGCGKIGQALADKLHAQGAEVYGFRRNSAALSSPIIAHSIDLHQPASLAILGEIAFDYVVITLTPDSSNEQAYQQTYVQGLQHILTVLNRSRLKRLFWVSSTSVYGQNDDSWVDENSPTEPNSFSGKAQVAAEQLLMTMDTATIVRFAGIYRSERYRLAEKIKAGEISQTIEPNGYSNRIHFDDCVGVLVHLLLLAQQGVALEKIYLGVDSEPVRYSELVSFLADKLGVTLNVDGVSRVGQAPSKRCSNRRLLKTGYQFIYPSFRDGLKGIS